MRPSSSFLCFPRVFFRSPARQRSPKQRWTSSLSTGKISGSEHQIRGFLGHIRRGDTLPVRTLHKGVGPDGITRGKDVSERLGVMSGHRVGVLAET